MKRYRQRPVKGGRDPLPSCVVHKIKVEIERTARKFECSKSFVVSTILAEAFGINIDERYYDYEREDSKRRNLAAKREAERVRQRDIDSRRKLKIVRAKKKSVRRLSIRYLVRRKIQIRVLLKRDLYMDLTILIGHSYQRIRNVCKQWHQREQS